MMISFSTIELGVSILFRISAPAIQENTKRLSRVSTLDGGCVFSYAGFFEADRTFIFEGTNVPKDICDDLWAFFKAESLVCLACDNGVFTGYIHNLKVVSGTMSLTFLVYQKLT